MKKEKEIDVNDIKQLTSLRTNLLAQIFAFDKADLQGNTHWEEITCVGYLPEKRQLEAVFQVKQSSGYSGGLCTNGSFEYVRFFVDWGSGFQDIGFTSVNVHNISDAPAGEQHPIEYLVYHELDEANHKRFCTAPVLPKVMAVLSWNAIPSTDPTVPPVFGNAIECFVQINPKTFFIKDIFKIQDKIEIDPDIFQNYNLDEPLPIKPIAEQQSLSHDLVKEYQKFEIPDHRTFYPAIQSLVKPTALNLPDIGFEKSILEEFNINIDDLLQAIDKDKANVSYEELCCVGLNTKTDKLGAIVRIKRPSGYGGNLCKKGSFEHVAFWADWNNNGTWDEYLGTVSVRVHDIYNIPDEGLCYAVELPINVSQYLKPCFSPNIIKVRGVLSWSSLPSTTDPNDLNSWGNRVDALVQIRPGIPIPGDQFGHRIDFIGNVLVDQIDPISHLAFPSPIASPSSNRPWGQGVNFRAEILNSGAPGSIHYQVQYFDNGLSDWVPVNNEFSFTTAEPAPGGGTLINSVHINAADFGGWFPYLADQSAGRVIVNDLLGNWNTVGKSGVHSIRLAFTNDHTHNPINIQYSEVYEIMIDNVLLNPNPDFGVAINPAYSVDLVIDGGDCHQYQKGSSFTGHLRVIDKYFAKWILQLQPTAHYTGAPISPASRQVASLVDNGDGNAAWQLDTTTLDPCGYTVRLIGYKRTILNSNVGHLPWRDKYVGFSVV